MHGVMLLLAYGLASISLLFLAVLAFVAVFRWIIPPHPSSELLSLVITANNQYTKLITDMTGNTVITEEDRAAIIRWRRNATIPMMINQGRKRRCRKPYSGGAL